MTIQYGVIARKSQPTKTQQKKARYKQKEISIIMKRTTALIYTGAYFHLCVALVAVFHHTIGQVLRKACEWLRHERGVMFFCFVLVLVFLKRKYISPLKGDKKDVLF